MNLKFYIILPVLAICCTGISEAQKRSTQTSVKLEDLPRVALDTVPTRDSLTFVILYSNNTWKYYRPALEAQYAGIKEYSDHWETKKIFAYADIELADLPAVTDINLIGSLQDFHYPIIGKVFSKYGRRGRRNHNGVDIPLKTGEPIYATFEGRVRYSQYNTGGYGNMVIIRHRNGLETWYAHLSKTNAQAGDYVKAGDIIGFGGSTGRSRGPHLHYEVRYCDQTFDPEHIVDFETGAIKYQTFALEKSFFNIHSRASDELEDHDLFDDLAVTGADGEEVTSEDILAHIANAQTAPKATTVSAAQGDAVYHTIKSGDILGRLARRYGTTVGNICRLNSITPTTTLRIGRTLRVK